VIQRFGGLRACLETFPVGWRARVGLHCLLYRQEDIRLAAGAAT
jgi:hypothetical protein